MDLQGKLQTLRELIRGYGSAVVAFSGGVDSSVVLALAKQELGDRVLAVTAHSPVYARRELEAAKELARQLGVAHEIIFTRELDDPRYVNNPPTRCFHCKQELFAKLTELARARGFAVVLDGTNASDTNDFRPGMRALSEYNVKSPLLEVGLTKPEVRELARMLKLPTAEKPAMACLASRLPYGSAITLEKLRQIEHAEEVLFELGFSQVRVRHYDEIARIEVPPDEMSKLLAHRDIVIDRLRKLGFRYVTLDLAGYRGGSMNEALKTIESFAKADLERESRCGVAEVVFCPGKTPEQIAAIMNELSKTTKPVLATRATVEQARAVKALLPDVVYHEQARLLTLGAPKEPQGGTVLVITAGTSDISVAEEAAVTAQYLGNFVERLYDVGVAGLHRILAHRERLNAAKILIVVAGMDGVLPSVVAGLVDKPVIAVPTSIGYGASFGGLSALLTMLNSCAPGVAVVNIDNGFGAAVLATKINRL
ncbi:MAG: nickel pincer cofactor biosynthesis protein LarB [Candidatus Bipolaricaulota bacterium]|nr:nickel pincer cofactor biosynthesis protein LarB [Candidatus Bipolaricaulota bacterium]